MTFNKFKNAVKEMAQHEDHSEAQAGGTFAPLEEGPVRARLVEYIELGQHEKVWQGKKSFVEKVSVGFEVTGPKLTPRDDGEPHIIRIRLTKSLSDKSGYYKLFRALDHTGEAKVFPALLGEAFRGQIIHSHVGEGAERRTYANLKNADGAFTLAPPFFDDPESAERRTLAVPEPKSPCRCFVWNYPDKEQWDSLFIDGEWEARDGKPAKSKNIWQELIKAANNWAGSPMQELLFGSLDIGDVEKPAKSGAAVDPLDDEIPF